MPDVTGRRIRACAVLTRADLGHTPLRSPRIRFRTCPAARCARSELRRAHTELSNLNLSQLVVLFANARAPPAENTVSTGQRIAIARDDSDKGSLRAVAPLLIRIDVEAQSTMPEVQTGGSIGHRPRQSLARVQAGHVHCVRARVAGAMRRCHLDATSRRETPITVSSVCMNENTETSSKLLARVSFGNQTANAGLSVPDLRLQAGERERYPVRAFTARGCPDKAPAVEGARSEV